MAMRNQQAALHSEMKQIEDQKLVEVVECQLIIQNARAESHEFGQQYNHVINSWRLAEESSNRSQSDFQSEFMLFQEAKTHLQEMQQQFGNVMQEDYGASLRILELEGILTRERALHQQRAEQFSQGTHQEFMQSKADRIREEAREALAAKEYQQFHERELITDKAVRLKSTNEKLISEYHFAQQGAKRAWQVLHQEQQIALAEKMKLAEEELAASNLRNELHTATSIMDMEGKKKEQLRVQLSDGRVRYEQKLADIAANPQLQIANSFHPT